MLKEHYGTLLIIGGIAGVIYFLTLSAGSQPHLYAKPPGPDYAGTINSIAVLIGSITTLLGAIGGFLKFIGGDDGTKTGDDGTKTVSTPTWFREIPPGYNGPVVMVQIFSHVDQFGRRYYKEYRCYAIKDPNH